MIRIGEGRMERAVGGEEGARRAGSVQEEVV